MQKLRQAIKNKALKGVYLLSGSEKYLLHSYAQSFIKAAIPPELTDMNLTRFEGKAAEVDRIIDAAETLPFLCEQKLVVVRDSGLFYTGNKDESEKIAQYLTQTYGDKTAAPPTILLFVEEQIDKRGKAYKAAAKVGTVVQFEPLKESALVAWMNDLLRKRHFYISGSDATYLLRICGANMEAVLKELEKLMAYKGEGAITRQDIDTLCTKSTEARIFDLIDAVAAKNSGQALLIYQELLMMKEQPVGILALLNRQFRLMLKSLLLSRRSMNEKAIAETLSQHPYAVKIALGQSRGFGQALLEQAVLKTAECDRRIKSGLADARLAVELLIIEYAR